MGCTPWSIKQNLTVLKNLKTNSTATNIKATPKSNVHNLSVRLKANIFVRTLQTF